MPFDFLSFESDLFDSGYVVDYPSAFSAGMILLSLFDDCIVFQLILMGFQSERDTNEPSAQFKRVGFRNSYSGLREYCSMRQYELILVCIYSVRRIFCRPK